MPRTSSLAIIAAMFISALAPGAALAAGSAKAAWVSGHGTNAAGCGSLTNPCQTFQYTHDNVVAAGGLIAVLDSSNYGPLVIRNAISIVDDGGLAGIAVASGDAIDIQAGPNDAVFLKGLHIDGLGTANNGIYLTSAGKLTIVNCTIKGFGATTPDNGNGIRISVNSGSLDFSVSNTIVSLNSGVGVWLDLNGSSSPTASLKNVTLTSNATGLVANASGSSGNAIVTIEDSVATRNSAIGFAAAARTPNVTIVADRVNASFNGSGLEAIGGAILLSNSVATGNGTDLNNNGGTLTSYQNNVWTTHSGTISNASLH